MSAVAAPNPPAATPTPAPAAVRWLPAVLRAAVLLVVAAALLLPRLWRSDSAAGAVVTLRSPADVRREALLAGAAPAALVYSASAPPGAAELDALAAASTRAPLYLALPREVRSVGAAAGPRMLAGRAAAVTFRLRGAPRDSARVFLTEAGARVDSARVTADASGSAKGAFRVRPAVPGWREWSVVARWPRGDSVVAPSAAWVDSAGAPRVLLRAGFPDWESKFVARALEESGARVDQAFALGRGLTVEEGSGSAITPSSVTRACRSRATSSAAGTSRPRAPR